MGREIRMVPPNWEHPKRENGNFKPMLNESSTDAFNKWLSDYEEFKLKELKDACKEYGYPENDPYYAFCDYHGSPPDAEYYRPNWGKEKATWFQVYETVSEGTPVTPPFETKEELVEYLIKNGDYWDQDRRNSNMAKLINCEPWTRDQAENFVNTGWAMSFVISDGKMMSGVEAITKLKNETA